MSKPIEILKIFALLVVYSAASFVYFYYNSDTNDGIRFGFDITTVTYSLYLIVSLIVSLWMVYGKSFNKQVLKVAGILIGLNIVTWLVPLYFVPLGWVLFSPFIVTLIIFAIAAVVHNVTKPLIDKPVVSAVIAILLFIILCPLVWANYHDLSVKEIIVEKENSMFKSIDECDAYLSPIRQLDCREGWRILHYGWNQ